ncbi:bifunctional diguanylate cyclase/phosphodiesterase [Acuticoccus sp. I52.16.1]|uniref:putative bifunctional diguanylate cyclase/phosphodiesterase n=1 Tax=Acuticoccus sp. I52.16.1 TaxID=2928472 RepID=UPI001FD12269|nr:EAL domain-containing protein [Acuticoccus sp. I52.16.1]UOM32894.1 EAL domain-containing protein [Acuticoccus sp. I52.16.1]
MAVSATSLRNERGFRKIFILNIVAGLIIATTFGIGAFRVLDFLDHGLATILEKGARRWVAPMSEAPFFDVALSGNEPPADVVATVFKSFNDHGIDRVRVYGLDGKPAWAAPGDEDTARPLAPKVIEALRADEWSLRIYPTPYGEGETRHYADLLMPIRRDGATVGALGMRIHVSEAHAQYVTAIAFAVVGFTLLGLVGVVATVANAVLIARQRRHSDEIYHLAHHDALTGVANRNRFLATLDRAMLPAKLREGGVAVHVIDVDGFKGVNDSLGHDIGDQLLRVVAARLLDCAGEGDLVSRLGGDEFAVVQRHATRQSALELAERMLEAARAIRDLDGVPVSASLSIGVALAPEHATLSSELQKCADAAVYRAKREGRNQAVVFEVGMDGELKTRNTLRVMLRRALETDSFELHYQPIHEAHTNSLLGFEALLRLHDGDGGNISPAKFIPIAEDMGLTPRIGQWVLNEACRTAACWPAELSIAVNLSVQQFREDLATVVESALALSGLEASRLELEITETLFIAEPDQVVEQLRRIKALGVRVVMDDFGTGYSSLSYLWKFPFDKLKVDRSCFKSLDESESVGEVLRTISAMSGAMNLRVVAEGIETEVQRTFACQAGYDELQGYLCGRPMSLEAVLQYIRNSTVARRTVPDDIPMVRPSLLN